MEITGKRFGRLTVVTKVPGDRRNKAKYLCSCDCGGSASTTFSNLSRGQTRSCGCLRRETASRNFATLSGPHFEQRRQFPSEYQSWRGMLARAYYSQPGHKDFENYKGRGIGVSERWVKGENGVSAFQCFLDDLGPKPSGWTLERIDNDRSYDPSNCKWATRKEQIANQRKRRTRAAA